MIKLIIISGSEATGKSTVRDEIVKRLKLEYLSKDIIKEKMFDEAGVSTWKYSWYESRAKDELFKQVGDYLHSQQSFIIEANFKPADRDRLKGLLNPQTDIYEIFCSAKGFTAFRRFVKRRESGQRHPGHHDRRWYLTVFINSLCSILKLKWPYRPMRLSNQLLYLDTTDMTSIDYPAIIKFIGQPI